MIRYSNRFKAGTRRNKKWAASKGPDRHVSLEKDSGASILQHAAYGNPRLHMFQDATFKSKPNHIDRAINVDWKAINDAKKAEKLMAEAIKTATIEPGHISPKE